MPTNVGPAEIVIILAILALLVLIPAGVIAIGLRLAGVGRVEQPEQVLRRRLASGEITEAEYESRLTALRR